MSRDVYASVTARIMDALAQGVVPWHQPWDVRQGRPRNLVSGSVYRGVNVWVLTAAGSSPFWLTYRQAQKIGGHVKKGERGVEVVFWKWVEKRPEADAADDAKPERFAVARSFTVFNATQCELPEAWRERAEIKAPEGDAAQKIRSCERIVAHMPNRPEIVHAGVRAFYRPSVDQVTMPEPGSFEAPELYYSILFHELTHSTGHAARLNRATLVDAVRFGDTNYSKEELVAEMGAAFLCGVAGIENRTIDNSAGYVQGWLKKLSNDPRLLVQAASQAQRAADYILGLDSQAEE